MAHSGVYLSEDATKKLQEGIQAISSILSNQPTAQPDNAPEQVAGPSQWTSRSFPCQKAGMKLEEEGVEGVELEQAQNILEVVGTINPYFARFISGPSTGAFSDLQTTVESTNVDMAPLLDFFDIDANVLNGKSDRAAIQTAVSRLAKVLGDTKQQTQLLAQLENAPNEKFQMMSIVKHLLVPLVDQVVLNKREYDDISVAKGGVKDIRREHLGMGSRYTWRGAPDCRCDIDILSLTILQ